MYKKKKEKDMAGRVLVVDDEKMIVKGLKFSLMQDSGVFVFRFD